MLARAETRGHAPVEWCYVMCLKRSTSKPTFTFKSTIYNILSFFSPHTASSNTRPETKCHWKINYKVSYNVSQVSSQTWWCTINILPSLCVLSQQWGYSLQWFLTIPCAREDGHWRLWSNIQMPKYDHKWFSGTEVTHHRIGDIWHAGGGTCL